MVLFVLSKCFEYSHIVIATTTYNAGIFESMETFLNSMLAHNLQNRKFVIIQNGSWAATCGKQVKELLESIKGSEILDDTLCVNSALKEEQLRDLEKISNLLVESINKQ